MHICHYYTFLKISVFLTKANFTLLSEGISERLQLNKGMICSGRRMVRLVLRQKKKKKKKKNGQTAASSAFDSVSIVIFRIIGDDRAI